MKIFSIFVTIMGMAMSLSYFLQAWKIWKEKSAKAISITFYVIFSLGTLVWLIYGILIKDYQVIISFTLGVIGSWTVLLLTIKYKNY